MAVESCGSSFTAATGSTSTMLPHLGQVRICPMTDSSRTRKRAWHVVHAIENGSTQSPCWASTQGIVFERCNRPRCWMPPVIGLFYRFIYLGRNASGSVYFPSADLRVVIKMMLFVGLSASGATTQISFWSISEGSLTVVMGLALRTIDVRISESLASFMSKSLIRWFFVIPSTCK